MTKRVGHVMWKYLLIVVALCNGLWRCASTSGISVDDLFSDTMRQLDNSGRPARSGPARSRLLAARSGAAGSVSGAYREGSGSFVSARAPMVQTGTMTVDGLSNC